MRAVPGWDVLTVAGGDEHGDLSTMPGRHGDYRARGGERGSVLLPSRAIPCGGGPLRALPGGPIFRCGGEREGLVLQVPAQSRFFIKEVEGSVVSSSVLSSPHCKPMQCTTRIWVPQTNRQG